MQKIGVSFWILLLDVCYYVVGLKPEKASDLGMTEAKAIMHAPNCDIYLSYHYNRTYTTMIPVLSR